MHQDQDLRILFEARLCIFFKFRPDRTELRKMRMRYDLRKFSSCMQSGCEYAYV